MFYVALETEIERASDIRSVVQQIRGLIYCV
jgi:hypothetical protein